MSNLKYTKWFFVSLAVIFLTACSGKTGSGSKEQVVVKLQDQNKTFVVNDEQVLDIVDRTIDEDNTSIKVITLDETLAQEVKTDTDIIMIPSGNDKFPLGYMGKILETKTNPDGSMEVKVEDATLEDVSSISMPKTTYELEKMNFVGLISPFGESTSSNNKGTIKQQKVLYSDPHDINFDGEKINIKGKDTNKLKLELKKGLNLELSGTISKVKLISQGEYRIEALSDGQLFKVNFSEDLHLSYNSDLQLALKGKYKGTLGYFDDEWKDIEKKAFDKYGITVKGLKSTDKNGKIPIAGLVYNGAVTGGTSVNNAITTATAGGIIIWVYADMSGELSIDGSIGMASHTHNEFSFKKKLDETVPTISSSITAQEGKRYLEAPFVEGNLGVTITKGISLEADVIVGGLRILNAGIDLKGEIKEELKTKERLSYGVDNPGDEWTWSDGTICSQGSLGAGFIAHADFAIGLTYKDKLDKKVTSSFQYPKQSDIDKITEGRVGSWYKFISHKDCFDVPSPATLNNNHIKAHRQAISAEELKDLSDANYKYAYLSSRIYKDTTVNTEANGWKLVDISYKPKTGFKAGLYKNIYTGEHIVAYGGTTANSFDATAGKTYDAVADLVTDLSLLSIFSFNQPSEALDFIKRAKNLASNDNAEINGITGHSLGGGLAQYAGLYSGIKTVTFNTAPVPFNVLGSYSDFKDVVTITEEPDFMQSVKFLYEDRITNIMTPYDPVSTISTALMSIDESDAAYMMAARFMLGIPPIQKLDYLITGKQIYLPVDNAGGIINFSNHAMDLIVNTFDVNTNYEVSFNTQISNGDVSIENVTVKDKNGNSIDRVSSYWAIYDQNGNEVGTGELGDPITELPEGQYSLWMFIQLEDGKIVASTQDITVSGVQERLTLELLNPVACKAATEVCKFEVSVVYDGVAYTGNIDFGDGGLEQFSGGVDTSASTSPGGSGQFSGGVDTSASTSPGVSSDSVDIGLNLPPSDGSNVPPADGPNIPPGDTTDTSGSQVDVNGFVFEHSYEQSGSYTVTATVTQEDGQELDPVSIDVVVEGVVASSSKLKKTGQTKSYDEAGNEVTDGSIKDDGYYQKGVTPSYTRDDVKQIVTDHVTGLEWQDDAAVASVTKPWVTQTNYDAGNYSDTSGDTAATYCATLSLDGGGWRLPTRAELQGIADYGRVSPAIHPAFENVASYYYWSSTTDAGGTNYAWNVHFNYGHQSYYGKYNNYYVRCVRAGQ